LKALIENLKQNGQDFEFYPTTREIIEKVCQDITRHQSGVNLLDVGAGNGHFFKIAEEIQKASEDADTPRKFNIYKKYAIEKSAILIKEMPEDVFILGTDFMEQTLIDKRVDVIFCNPPYSEFKEWVIKIIKEANASHIYLVIPERWKDQPEILAALKRRKETSRYSVIGSFDFLHSEFREARAKVEIVHINLSDSSYHSSREMCEVDPFDLWFEETFKFQAEKEKTSDYQDEAAKKEQLHALVKGRNLLETLSELYINATQELLKTYRVVEGLPADILKELNVDLKGLKEGLKVKIKGLKAIYWKELFDNLDKLTDLLTSDSRKKLLDKLFEHTDIDFTVNNAYAVILWAVKNANKYMDSQLCDMFHELTAQENIHNYKSNKAILQSSWRYRDTKHSHYTLDYRIVVTRYNCFNSSDYGRFEYPNGLHKDVNNFLNDLCTIGRNLGFDVLSSSFDMSWDAGKENDFYMNSGDGEKLFMSVRAYKKGTVHIKFNQNFIKALNIEAARINKWINTPADIISETDIEPEFVQHYFNRNFKVGMHYIPCITQQ